LSRFCQKRKNNSLINSGTFRLVFVVFLLLVLTVIPAHAEKFFSAWNTKPEKQILENGHTLIYELDRSSDITVLQIVIGGGKRADPVNKEGLAYITTRLTLEIPDSRTTQTLLIQATQVSMTCLADFSLIELSCLSENLEETLKLLSKLIEDPLLTGIRIKRMKEMMNQSRKVKEDDPGYVSNNTFFCEFFQGTSYALPFLGSEKSLKSIKKKDIENFYKKHFIKENMIFVVSSNLGKDKIIPWVENFFDDFSAGPIESPQPISFTLPENKTLDLVKDTQQTLVSCAYPLPETNPPKNYIFAYLLNNLLGQGPNSRLWPLRMDKKLAYNVSSRLTQMKSGGLLEAYLETDIEKKTVAVDELKKVLDDLYNLGISEEELHVTKTFSRAVFLRAHETKSARTRTLALFEILGLGYDFINTFFEEMEKVTQEEINNYIKIMLNPENRILVTVGPEATDKDLL